jgi:tetratricopeptide (TPR) repeat protein
VLSLHEDYPDAHYNLAVSLEALGDYPAAAKHRARFAQLVPDSPWAEQGIAMIDTSGQLDLANGE